MDQAEIEEVDALKEMERAKLEIREREDRKGVTQDAKGEPAVPKMKITVSVASYPSRTVDLNELLQAAKQSGVARSRHQLSTMLMEAYQNREALEDKIAEGRRNRKEAGNKYGAYSACRYRFTLSYGLQVSSYHFLQLAFSRVGGDILYNLLQCAR